MSISPRAATGTRFLRSALLLLPSAFIQAGPHPVRAAETKAAAASASDRAWLALRHAYETPPPPLRQLPDRMYTQQEIRDYYARTAKLAGAVADEAKRFYTKYPEYPQAAKARQIYFDMLHTAVGLSGKDRVPELEAATAERLKDPKLDEDARFQLSLRLLQSTVSGRQYESDDAMRAELEKRARQLAKDYPDRAEGDKYLLNLAQEAAPEKSEALAREILAGPADAAMKAECRGLINRSEAVGKPLDLTLALSDGKTLKLDQPRDKVTLLLFWDSASRFSAKAIWAVNELYKKYHAQGLEAVGLNFDADPAKEAATLKDVSPEWPQYRDAAAGWQVRDRFGADTLPMCWFVDKKGVLRELKGERDPEGITKRLMAE